jgi:hypothetical protein
MNINKFYFHIMHCDANFMDKQAAGRRCCVATAKLFSPLKLWKKIFINAHNIKSCLPKHSAEQEMMHTHKYRQLGAKMHNINLCKNLQR